MRCRFRSEIPGNKLGLPVRRWLRWTLERRIGYTGGTSDLAYFEYALVLPEERYLIEVQTRKPDSGELLGQEEIEGIAKECLVLVIGEGHADEVKDVKPSSISESGAQNLKKVQQLLDRPDGAVFLVE